jgi:hypothetical protein
MTAFQHTAQCSLAEVLQHFRGACCLNHQGDEQAMCEKMVADITISRIRWNFGGPMGIGVTRQKNGVSQ